MFFNLEGQSALITGASGGIGSAIAEVLVQSGAKVIATGTNPEKLRNLANKINSNKLLTLTHDLSDSNELESLFTKAESMVEHIDILICNAGITYDNLSIRMKEEEWQKVIDLNLTTTFKLNQLAIKRMMRKKYGRIINISSIIAFTGNIGQANYAAAKAGMIGMSKSLALEVASRNITVNCIAPGFIDTPMTAVLKTEIKENLIKHIPMGRIGTPMEVAHSVLFLAAKESAYITGTTIHVNGGMYM